jgi:probable F420-dependent oxidoreductase
MDAATSTTARFGRFGVWLDDRSITAEVATEIEKMGFGAAWVGGSPDGDLRWAEPALAATTTLTLASAIVTIWSTPAATAAQTFHRIDESFPGRFYLGIGIGHPEHAGDYRRPYDALTSYLDELDQHGVPADRRILAALGPRVTRLAVQRSIGTHPYLTTAEDTASTREAIGPQPFLAPEHKVVWSTDTAYARAVGRNTLDKYLGLSNMTTSLRRLGFTDDDLVEPGSDRLVDALIAHGHPDAIAERLHQHHSSARRTTAIRRPPRAEQSRPDPAAVARPLFVEDAAAPPATAATGCWSDRPKVWPRTCSGVFTPAPPMTSRTSPPR